jgi:hypothetical protein
VQWQKKVKLSVDERKKVIEKMADDPYLAEVEVVARIKAYYQIAANRFIDRICQTVEFDLFQKLTAGLKDELEAGLQIYGQNGMLTRCMPPRISLTMIVGYGFCRALLEVDPERALLRKRLEHEKKVLDKANDRLISLFVPMAHNNDDAMEI